MQEHPDVWEFGLKEIRGRMGDGSREVAEAKHQQGLAEHGRAKRLQAGSGNQGGVHGGLQQRACLQAGAAIVFRGSTVTVAIVVMAFFGLPMFVGGGFAAMVAVRCCGRSHGNSLKPLRQVRHVAGKLNHIHAQEGRQQ
ncbi:hypothetical protein [Pontibacter chitinilyticus]|uniref:hypothetical protein n=1 Tax=Pontibacter chitinilyticus TaxID=2674989 RepID=UPI00321AD8D4